MTTTTQLHVSGMSCQGCVRSVTTIIAKTIGIEKDQVQVSLEREEASFPQPSDEHLVQLLAKLERQGFTSRTKAS